MADNTLKIDLASAEVRMGEPATSVVTIDIKNTTHDPVTQVLYLLIPKSFVDADHMSNIKFGPADLYPEPLSDAPQGMTKYQLGSTRGVAFLAGQTITLSLSNIAAVALGPQTLQIQWGARGGDLHSADITIDVIGADEVPKIIEFKAKNSVLSLTGTPPVELSWDTSEESIVKLFRMDTQLLPEANKSSAPTKMINYPDKGYKVAGLYPYRLEVTAKGKTISRTIFVRVQAPGWNRIECDQGAPINILSDDGNTLYGIFNSYRGSAIYPLDPAKGSMGTQNDMCKNGAVPDALQTSPAVYFQNKIFVVGGSQVDASVFSNQVHAYDPKTATWTDLSEGVPWSARMGHAITSYKGKLWVTGGVDENGNTRKDTYYTENGETWTAGDDLPAEMCFHALAGFTFTSGTEKIDRLWLYAGLNSPFGKPYTSMWYWPDGNKWKELSFYISSGKTSYDPGFGAPFGAALTTAYDANAKQNVLRVVATYQTGSAKLDSAMYSLKLPDPANLNQSGGDPTDQTDWRTSAPNQTTQPFQLCAATHGNYIFVQSILSGFATNTLTFYVT